MTIRKTKPHAEDLRKGRYFEHNRIYLVTIVTEQRQKVFTYFPWEGLLFMRCGINNKK